ncbi:MAG: DotD/TraH family lipoprotein [Pseudomonadota bacterium]|nr:DotD/TraH family lipoprotein [Pseudomonadota bacterium]
MYSILIILFAFSLSGCTPTGGSTEGTTDNTPELYTALTQAAKSSRYDEIDSNDKLSEAAASVSQSLAELAQIERSVYEVKSFKSDPNLVRIKAGKVSIDWTGPVESLLGKISQSTKLHYRTIGNKPPLPIIVSITAKDVYVSDLIRDISYKVQSQAAISLSKDNVLELRYYKS